MSGTRYAKWIFTGAGVYGLAAVAEKATYGVAAIALYLDGRAAGSFVAAGVVDLVLGVLFASTFVRTSTAKT